MTPSISRQGALEALLVTIFNDEELRRFLRGIPDIEPLSGLPGGSSPLSKIAYEAVGLLDRHGVIDDEFFATLVEVRPRQRPWIEKVAAMWGVYFSAMATSLGTEDHETMQSPGSPRLRPNSTSRDKLEASQPIKAIRGKAHVGGACHGVAKGGRGASPFVPVGPVVTDSNFVGRHRERGLILDEMDRGSPIQILGSAMVGKSSMLRWAERHSPPRKPIIRIAAQGLCPSMLVAAIARALGRMDLAVSLEKGGADLHKAKMGLGELASARYGPDSGFVLLLDEADKLVIAGGHEHDGFLEYVRGLVEARLLLWISTSRRDLYEAFKSRGLTSRFLNSSRRLWLGPIEEYAAHSLVGKMDPSLRSVVLCEAGGFAFGIQWLGDRLWHLEGRRDADIDDIIIAYRNEMSRGPFERWWTDLTPQHRLVLTLCCKSHQPYTHDASIRCEINELQERGLLQKADGVHVVPNGNAWVDYILGQGIAP